MAFDQIWLLLLIAPLVLWMIFASHQSRTAGRFAINTFGILILLAFSLTGFVPRKCGLTGFVSRKSNVADEALAQALTGVSGTDLRQGKRRIYVIKTNKSKVIY